MKKSYRLLLFLSLLAISLFTSTTIYATNGHQLSAIGAYQQGMAGAVTAAPYDASTSITNPAGMAMIGNRTDFSFQAFFPNRSIDFAGGGSSAGGSGWYLVPAVGWTAPANDRGDIFAGGGMYGVSGMGVDYDVISAPAIAGMMGWAGAQAHIWSQFQFWKLAPTIALKADKLAVGLALNLDYQAFGFKNQFTQVGGTGKFGMDLSQMQGAIGYGATVGVIYEFTRAFSVGASYATKQKFSDFKWRLAAGDVSNVPDINGNPASSQDGIYKMDLDFPQQWAVGIAVRPARTLLWTADVKWINYHDTYNVVNLRGNFSTGASAVPLNFGWSDVWVYATALQYEVTPNFVVRAGFNHSSSPIKSEDVDNNLAFPAIVENRVSGGFTYRFGRHWEMTMAYMKAFKETLTAPAPPFGTHTTISLEEQAVDMEFSYRF